MNSITNTPRAPAPLLWNTKSAYLSLSRETVKYSGGEKSVFKVGFQRELVQGCEPSMQNKAEVLREMKSEVVLYLCFWLEDALQVH